jgi:alkylation response protein AidB-like acyl-CoA dehydrogenase
MTITLLTDDEVRDDVRRFVADAWDPELTLGEWWERLADSGWAVPTWPVEWLGKGLPGSAARVVADELRAAGALGPPAGLGLLLAGPTILTHGTEEQKERYLRPIVDGQEAWCQLFSEPGAGSDLASLQTRAVRDGDEWVVNGQKVWTSGAQTADFGMLLARTDPDAPKHKGISYFAFPMDQPGVEVRPLREMTGRSLFCEVFFTDARVSNSACINGLGGGWIAANTTLAAERAGLGVGGSGAAGGGFPGWKSGMLGLKVGDLIADARATAAQASRSERGQALMIRVARELGRNEDPVVRQRLAQAYILEEVGRMMSLRAKQLRAAGDGLPGEGNLAKLLMSRVLRHGRDLGPEIIGPYATIMGEDTPGEGNLQEATIWAPAPSIYGGSDEIQKNIVGERVLGLPKEPGPDKNTPFRQLLVGTQTT